MKAHGGRRHGLGPPGRRADRLVVSLSPADRGALDQLAATRGLSLAEVVRALIREASSTTG